MLLNLILIVIGMAVLGVGYYISFSNEKFTSGIISSILAILIFTFAASFTIIPTGYTGVKKIFGQVNEKTLSTGFNFHVPFVQSIKLINNKQQDLVFKKNKIQSETSERNTVTFTGITVTYQIMSNKSAWIVANITDYENNLLPESLVASAIKTSSKTLTPIDVTNRSILEPIAREKIQESVDEKYGKEVIYINKVVINDASFDKEYDKKIAQKQQAQMEYEKQQIENKKNIEKAEADATVKEKNAQADANAKKIAAEAEAEANQKLEKSLTDKVLRSKMLDKWNGELPKVTGENGSMFDYSSLMTQK